MPARRMVAWRLTCALRGRIGWQDTAESKGLMTMSGNEAEK